MAVFRPAERVRGLPGNFFSGLDADVRGARAAGVDVIDLSKGNPDLPTPPHIVAAMQAAVADPGNHRYPAFLARPALLAAIAERYRADHGVRVAAEQVAIFHGSHEALVAAVLGLADPGTAVILPDPGYPAYRSLAELAGARPVALPLPAEHGFQPDVAALDADDVAAASVLLLNYPHNPTGAVATPETFRVAGELARAGGAVFVHDFAYSALGFDGRRPLSALAGDPEAEVTVEISTMSKTYNMAGWRFGYAVGNTTAIAAMRAYQAHGFSTVYGATQDAAAAALAGDQSAVAELVRIYQDRRDAVVPRLRTAGWDLAAADGTFFVWTRLPGAEDDLALTRRLLDEAGVAVAPGSGFGPRGAGWIRLSLVHDAAVLTDAVDRIARAVTR